MTAEIASLEERAEQIASHDLKVIELDKIDPAPIEWLWPNRIPSAMFSLLAGQPSVGKTTLALNMAAAVSRGRQWPDGTHRAPLGDTVILTVEDDPRYTLVPRLMAAEANMSHIRMVPSVSRLVGDMKVIDAPVLLSEDMRQLHGLLNQYPDTRLMIFDPLSAYLGVKDSHRDADVRQVLGPLTELAARHNVAVLGISHLSKAEGRSAISRVMGSTGIVAASRMAWLATQHEDELMMLPIKNNVGPDHGGLTYEIVPTTITDGIETSRIRWTGRTEINANEALASQSANLRAPKKSEAVEFLTDFLRNGPRSVNEVFDVGEGLGHSEKTIRRAYDELELQSIRENKYQGQFLWYTPEQAAAIESS